MSRVTDTQRAPYREGATTTRRRSLAQLTNASLELRNVSLELRNVSLELRNVGSELRNVSLSQGLLAHHQVSPSVDDLLGVGLYTHTRTPL